MLNSVLTNKGSLELTTVTPELEGLDTSNLYAHLKSEYGRSGIPLEVDFRSIVDWVKLGDQFTHQIHPYPAKLIPHIANFFTNCSVLAGKKEGVLDPFCGSGTVALEASLAGRTPYVADANPLALLITKVKTFGYDCSELNDCLFEIISRCRKYRSAPEVPIVNSHLWYSGDRKQALERILRSVLAVENSDVRDFFRVCFSVTARKFSNADPAISVPVRLRTKSKFSEITNSRISSRLAWIAEASPLEEFLRVSLSNIERVQEANLSFPNRHCAVAVSSDARDLAGLTSVASKVPLVVTSPPYGSAQKYIRASSITLNWLGFVDPKNLTSLEDQSIGREHAPVARQVLLDEDLPSEFEGLLRRVTTKNSLRSRITRQYLLEMRKALLEMASVTKDNGHVVIVTGNNQVCDEVLRNDEFTTQILKSSGMNLELSLIDHIKSRGLMTKRNKTASVISRESVLVFSK